MRAFAFVLLFLVASGAFHMSKRPTEPAALTLPYGADVSGEGWTLRVLTENGDAELKSEGEGEDKKWYLVSPTEQFVRFQYKHKGTHYVVSKVEGQDVNFDPGGNYTVIINRTFRVPAGKTRVVFEYK